MLRKRPPMHSFKRQIRRILRSNLSQNPVPVPFQVEKWIKLKAESVSRARALKGFARTPAMRFGLRHSTTDQRHARARRVS